MRIGIDFDNTIITYDEVFRAAARAQGLIEPGFDGSKQAVRDAIRLLPDGELTWQKLQGQVYGKGIVDAGLCNGVDSFLRRCRAEGAVVFIVSHKTEFGHYDPARVNLRTAALDWMTARGFFRPDGYGLAPDNVFFEGTRAEKLARIGTLDCSYFIDDLEEVLDDPGFPAGVQRILFSDRKPRRRPGPISSVRVGAISRRIYSVARIVGRRTKRTMSPRRCWGARSRCITSPPPAGATAASIGSIAAGGGLRSSNIRRGATTRATGLAPRSVRCR